MNGQYKVIKNNPIKIIIGKTNINDTGIIIIPKMMTPAITSQSFIFNFLSP